MDLTEPITVLRTFLISAVSYTEAQGPAQIIPAGLAGCNQSNQSAALERRAAALEQELDRTKQELSHSLCTGAGTRIICH